MKKRFTWLIVLLVISGSVIAQSVITSFNGGHSCFYPVRERMVTQSLNGTWKFKLIEGLSISSDLSGWEKPEYNALGWDNIIVPGNWETQGFKKPEYRAIGEYLGLYRTQFSYNPAWKGKHVILRFDGVHFGYECYINGQKAGEWGSSYNLCQFDITPYLNTTGKNSLCLKVTTRSMGWQFDCNDCWSIAGITRDVELYALDNIYLEDVTFVSDITEEQDASVKVKVNVNRFASDSKDYKLNISITDPQNNHVLGFTNPISDSEQIYTFEGKIRKPKLWTAETPHLYRMEVCIVDQNGVVVQRANEKVGMRNVFVDGFELKVNHRPVLLRGVCLNEIDPKLGRALTYKERRQQLEMMKAANINFIRTAHYPFGVDFLKLCDEMGFYVCCEVPFGHGDEHLKDKAYLPELQARAEATIRRDKNHPSVIIWSLGNENPYTSVVEEVIKYVKEKDPTRPRGLPQKGPYFASLISAKRQSKNVDIYMGHYLADVRIDTAVKESDKPFIMTEYAHSLGLSFDELEAKYAKVLAEPKLIGAAIWAWADQAVLTDGSSTIETEEQLWADDGNTLPKTSKVLQGAWIDPTRFLDSFGNNGTDGIVYADGYPQEDYFLVRKVYSPVVITTDKLSACSGTDKTFEVKLENRFDFISLHGYKLNWQLRNIRETLESGSIWLQTESRKQENVSVETHIPTDIKNNDLMLCLEILDPSGKAFYERNIEVEIVDHPKDYRSLISSIPASKKFRTKVTKNLAQASTESVKYELSDKGLLTITDAFGNAVARTPLLLRVGRMVTVSLEYQSLKSEFFWNPYILAPVVDKFEAMKIKDTLQVMLNCHWNRNDSTQQRVEGIVTVNIYPNGVLKLDYDIHPSDDAKGSFLELGLTLQLDNSFDVFRWLGEGPYTYTRGKTAYDERDCWALHRSDLRFIGNRGKVDVGVITDGTRGIGVWSSSGNIGVENVNHSIYVSQNEIVTSYGTKFTAPRGRKSMKELKHIKGTFMLFVDQPSQPIQLLESIFKPYSTVVPEQPYLKSYGW
ncbi:glycoside hydrolase family 2 TIM barrel-domain containing protein [Bacteroides thetaiotaomicron]|uniref:glycoside hydrolase family 2 TIM barrel-domain containing protein n=1 Tax=Bacteroides thetaiotaomicron TaxID=818 RepID=UPI0028F42511|nr:glycoside hydrolase family 2 TIM barrel-domain containing protein [Bacteroides thetaiotaomicron]WOG19181.1 glycoside hydrolase family 2 TIM barrel-domain containing protein [Bacteroides thetaiotaomicron]